jgi:hypothetical protein
VAARGNATVILDIALARPLVNMPAPQEPLDPALYESRAFIPITVVTLVLSLASTAVGLRVYTRAVLLRQFGSDDATAIVALVLAMGSGIMVASSECVSSNH